MFQFHRIAAAWIVMKDSCYQIFWPAQQRLTLVEYERVLNALLPFPIIFTWNAAYRYCFVKHHGANISQTIILSIYWRWVDIQSLHRYFPFPIWNEVTRIFPTVRWQRTIKPSGLLFSTTIKIFWSEVSSLTVVVDELNKSVCRPNAVELMSAIDRNWIGRKRMKRNKAGRRINTARCTVGNFCCWEYGTILGFPLKMKRKSAEFYLLR